VLTDATADLTFALLMAAARRVTEAAASVAAGDWLTWEPARFLGHDVQGATLGIIGMGRIGRAVARRASGFDMKIIHTRPDGLPLEDVLEQSDFLSLHCPLTPQTRHMIDSAALARMKPTAILINTARGPIVDQAALTKALNEGTIAGAVLDVTDPEPPDPEDPLLSAPNLVLVPHIGSATHSARERMSEMAVDSLLAALAGEEMPHAVWT
jgi:glyoxylate reductase